jgi:hypothetical protein
MKVLDRAGFAVPRQRLARLQAPTLLMIGDADLVLAEHVIELFRLVCGGVPGDLVPLPSSELAILPGTNHADLLERVEWLWSSDRGTADAASPHRPIRKRSCRARLTEPASLLGWSEVGHAPAGLPGSVSGRSPAWRAARIRLGPLAGDRPRASATVDGG